MQKSKKYIMNFEERLEKLKEIVEYLERDDISLKDSMEKYQESLHIVKDCYKELEEAELKIEIIKKEGRIFTESSDDKKENN